jgi:DNA polymerase-1
MLETILAKVGLPPHIKPLILNAIQCFPKVKDDDRMPRAVSICHERLINQIRAHPRKVILALGQHAAVSLTGITNIKITRVRGQVIPTSLAKHGVVLAVHPAFLMKQGGGGYSEWQRDLKKAVLLAQDRPPDVWEPPTYRVIKTIPEYAAFVHKAIKQPYLTGDIETSGFDFLSDWMISHGVTWNGEHVYIIPNRLIWRAESLTRRLMESRGPRWIWQNGKFDVKFFRAEGIRARVDEDTMLQSYALNETRGLHDLDQIALRELGAPHHKAELDQYLKRYKKADRSYALVPREALYKYQAYDIAKTHQIFFAQQPRITKDPHLSKLYRRVLIPASEMLAEVELEGILLDPEVVATNDKLCKDEIEAEVAKIQPYAIKYCGAPINVNSPAQLGDLLYNRMKLGPIGTSTDAKAIIQIQRKHNHPIVRPIQRVRKLAKRHGTYVKPALGWRYKDGKVHTSYLIHGTVNGRLASKDPNLQNMERGPFIRRQFIADPDEWLVEADLNQAELRCLAVMSGDPSLCEIYVEGKTSIHKVVSRRYFGENYNHEQYMRAKAVTFGIVYGRTAWTLAEEFDTTTEVAQEYIDGWFAQFPRAKEFIMDSRKAPARGWTMITNFGRKKRWGVVSYENLHDLENEAANYPHSSTASDINTVAACEVAPVLRERWNARICNLVHDSIYFKIRQDRQALDESLTYVLGVMARVPRDWGLTRVPFVADAKFGERWDSDAMQEWEPLQEAA